MWGWVDRIINSNVFLFFMGERRIIERVLCKYGLKLKSFGRIDGGRIDDTYLIECEERDYRIVAQKMNCRFDEKSMESEFLATNFLRKNGFPVASIILDLTRKAYVFVDGFFWKLDEFIENDKSAQPNCNKLFNAGEILGRFHNIFRDVEDKELFAGKWNPDTGELLKKTRYLVGNIDTDVATVQLGNNLIKTIKGFRIYDGLPNTILHGDPKFNNFLFRDDEIVGIIDLDTLHIGNELYDLGDALRNWCRTKDNRFSEDFFKAATKGYLSKNKLKIEKNEIMRAIAFITARLALRFFVDAFEKKHFKLDRKRFKNLHDQNISDCNKCFEYCENILSKIKN